MSNPEPDTTTDVWIKEVLRNSALEFIANTTYTRVDEKASQGLLDTLLVLSYEEQFVYTAGFLRFIFLTGVEAGRELKKLMELTGGDSTNTKPTG